MLKSCLPGTVRLATGLIDFLTQSLLICFDDNGRKSKTNDWFAYILNGHYNCFRFRFKSLALSFLLVT